MAFALARSSLLAALLAASAVFAGGCTVEDAGDDATREGDEGETAANVEEIVDVNHSAVKRQSIGNCWLYATASWAESLAKSASPTNAELNMSESYWTYWHWFDQIANGSPRTEIQTGGWFSTAVEIMARYGVMNEGSFIRSEAADEMSLRQKSALAKMNESLKNGALKTPEARRDRALVRRELDKAWELEPNVVTQLTRVFGSSVQRTFDRSTVSTRFTSIKRASDIKASLRDPQTKQPITGTLQDAIGTAGGYSRSGRLAWRSARYPWTTAERRAVLGRVQRALHDRQPVVITWYVDFNALDPQGRFLAPPATPGVQGGHMTVLEDYQIDGVPGFGTLPAGTVESRPEALTAALDPAAKIAFFRVKNSWGSYRPDRQFVLPGYHDLYMTYLDGPVKHCTQNATNTGSTDDCYDATPLGDFVLPAGY